MIDLLERWDTIYPNINAYGFTLLLYVLLYYIQ